MATNTTSDYQLMNQSKQSEKIKCLTISLIVTVVFLIICLSLAIFYGTTNGDNEGSKSSQSSACTSPECLNLAATMVNSMDESADPCTDFYQFACGGYIEEYDWELITEYSYGAFNLDSDRLKQIYFDAIFLDVNYTKMNFASINKSIDFYFACLYSDEDEESLYESYLMQSFLSAVNFSTSNTATWDATNSAGFQNAMGWLLARKWNIFMQTGVLGVGEPVFTQNAFYFAAINSSQWASIIENSLVPLYSLYFGLSEQEATVIGANVSQFFADMGGIVNSSLGQTLDNYDLTLAYYYLGKSANNFSVFGNSEVVNYENIYKITYNDPTLAALQNVVYFELDDVYFEKFNALVESTTPTIMQYTLFSSVMIFALNYQDTYEQTRSVNREDFCYAQSLSAFPFINGFINWNFAYGQEDFEFITKMVEDIRDNGIKAGIEKASWLDDASRAASNQKAEALALYVGIPPQLKNGSALDAYYGSVAIDRQNFLESLANLLDFAAEELEQVLKGTRQDLISPWPYDFWDATSFDSWLTGINAFYQPSQNYFTIPITISQKPFFSRSYPSAVNFGGLGAVVGHEISHGFDPSGSQFNWNGTYIEGGIWTEQSTAKYLEIIECLIDQYDEFEVAPGVFDDGNRTQTENTADNGGLSASYMAWEVWKKSYPEQSFSLPGVDLTQEQIFFMGWGMAWCEAARPDAYVGYRDVHSPNNARVWGAVQNMKEFASAYNCPARSRMNPDNKCVLWA